MLRWDAAGTLVVKPASAPGQAAKASGPVIAGMPNLHSHAFQRAMAGLTESWAVLPIHSGAGAS
jgi:formimidoylglutamate deiminase